MRSAAIRRGVLCGNQTRGARQDHRRGYGAEVTALPTNLGATMGLRGIACRLGHCRDCAANLPRRAAPAWLRAAGDRPGNVGPSESSRFIVVAPAIRVT